MTTVLFLPCSVKFKYYFDIYIPVTARHSHLYPIFLSFWAHRSTNFLMPCGELGKWLHDWFRSMCYDAIFSMLEPILDMTSILFPKPCHLPFNDWSSSLDPGERTAEIRAPSWPWGTRNKHKKSPFPIISNWESGIACYFSTRELILLYTSFYMHCGSAPSIFYLMGIEKELKKIRAHSMPSPGLGNFGDMKGFMFHKKRDDFS